jgi:hypothetical protein
MSAANNLKAAREVIASRARFANRPHRVAAGVTKPISVRAATAKHKASSSSAVDRLIKKLENPDSVRPPGRPRLLTSEEEDAIVAFVTWMEKAGFPASKAEIEDAANTLRRRRDPEAKAVGKSWYATFREDHPELQKTFLKAVDKSRESWEAGGITDLKEWFKRLTEAIRRFNIHASECWNADQAGIRVGCLRERIQCLVVRTRKKTRTQVLDPSNRETCSLIGTGNAVGDTVPPWAIFKTFPTLDYAYVDADPQIRFAKSETAFSNGEITFEWAQAFNRHSWEKSARVQSRGKPFVEWFGCDEFLRDPRRQYVQYDIPPTSHDPGEEIWRLLILDGFTGHGLFPFREYCLKFQILVIPLPPHSTHFLQPMDVGVFQPMKNTHQKILRRALRKGNITFSRLDFVKGLQASQSVSDGKTC